MAISKWRHFSEASAVRVSRYLNFRCRKFPVIRIFDLEKHSQRLKHERNILQLALVEADFPWVKGGTLACFLSDLFNRKCGDMQC